VPRSFPANDPEALAALQAELEAELHRLARQAQEALG
jgi:hypothetical protein